MPKVRKIEAPADALGAADAADDLRQQVNAAMATLKPRGYLATIAGPNRWLVWTPGVEQGQPMDGASILTLAQQLAPPAADEAPLMTVEQLDAAATWSNPDDAGVFRRPPGLAERSQIDPHALIDGRWQPRQAIDDAKLNELAASIIENGVLEELIAVVNEAGEYELITGHRRKLAAIRASVKVVPVRIVEKTAAQARALAIISNDEREDLTDVERGQAYEQIIADEGISEAELARRLSRPRSYIQQRRALASAAPEVAQALASGQISFTIARAIATGAPGHHLAQVEALKSLQNRSSWQGVATEQDAQTYAEGAILSTAKDALKNLGWKVKRFSTGSGKVLTVVYADHDRPHAWTGAEIMAALRDQRRPSESGEVPPSATISAADRKILKRRGWDVSTSEFAPWIVAQAPRAKFLRGDELPALVEQARKDFDDLKARYAAAGWTLIQSASSTSDSFEATTTEGRTEHPYSWLEATKLATKIESGKEAREPNTLMRECERCKEKKPVTYHQAGERSAYRCKECIAALNAEDQRIRAELRHELAAIAGDWIEAAPERVLRLFATAVPQSKRIGLPQYANQDAKASIIRAADPVTLRELLLDILESAAYAWRDVDIGGHAVAGDERTVGEGASE